MQAIVSLLVVGGLIAFGPIGWVILFVLVVVGIVQNSDKKNPPQREETVIIKEPQISDGAKNLPTPNPLIDNMWSTQLKELCAEYRFDGYFVSKAIPKDRLLNVLKHYPLAKGGEAIALIDTTSSGSAENGLLICENGISWLNFGISPTPLAMTWADFYSLSVSLDGTKIKLGKDVVFDTGSMHGNKKAIRSLLRRIGTLWGDSLNAEASNLLSPDFEDTQPERIPIEPPILSELIDINSADFESLLTLPGIGVPDAKLILLHRESSGPLSTVDELAEVLNLKPHTAERLRTCVTFSEVPAKKPAPTKEPIPIYPDPVPIPKPDRPQVPVPRAPVDF